jgi:hypothetical protein
MAIPEHMVKLVACKTYRLARSSNAESYESLASAKTIIACNCTVLKIRYNCSNKAELWHSFRLLIQAPTNYKKRSAISPFWLV